MTQSDIDSHGSVEEEKHASDQEEASAGAEGHPDFYCKRYSKVSHNHKFLSFFFFICRVAHHRSEAIEAGGEGRAKEIRIL